MLDTVYNHTLIIYKYDIAVLTHYLNCKPFGTYIAHLIQMLYIEFYNSLKVRLSYILYPAIADMLTKEHTKIRGNIRIILILICEINHWKPRIRRYNKPLCKILILKSVLNDKTNLIDLRLINLINPATYQIFFQFLYQTSYGNSVHRHNKISPKT